MLITFLCPDIFAMPYFAKKYIFCSNDKEENLIL